MTHFVRDRVVYSTGSEGETWARGANYKASFAATGATFIPFFGSNAPKDFPVAFRLESIASGGEAIAFDSVAPAVRDGNTITFDRGNVRELYELGLESMEQKFVIESAPTRGDLVLHMAVESELERSETPEGLEFRNELGGVRYGRATVIDAAGSRVAASTMHAPSMQSSGGLEIRVPASFIATARFPITIDPVVTSDWIVVGAPYHHAPDIAYEATSDHYLAVFEELYSLIDYDIVAYVLDANGNTLTYYYVDISSDNWTTPKVAANTRSHQWLVVAAVGVSSRVIWGRTLPSTTGTLGPKFTISNTPTFDCFAPDVGGDPTLSPPTFYFVVWESAFSTSDHDIHGQLIGPDSVLYGSTVFIEDSVAFESNPSISKSDGHLPFTTQNWNVVWQREISASDHDIYGAQIYWDGSFTNSAFPISAGPEDDTSPTASSLLDGPSGPRNWLVAYTTLYGDHDIIGRLMNGATTLDEKSISSLEAQAGSGTYTLEQLSPDVDSDGSSFVVTYLEQESAGSFHYNVNCASVVPIGSVVTLSEGHVALGAFEFFANSPPQITSIYSGLGGVARFAVICEEPDTGALIGGAIEYWLYDTQDFTSYCWPGYNGVLACPCGNPPATGAGCNNSASTGGAMLTESGTASLANDTAQFHTTGEKPTATSILLQGTALANTSFGQGVRCAGGTLKRLYVKTASGGSITAPDFGNGDPKVSVRSSSLGDPIAAGATRYYLVYYRDPIVLGGCPSVSTFNATQGGAVTWRP